MSTIVVNDLTKTYGEGELAVAAVRHVDLAIERGEVVLIMGPSGSGKTTLLLMLGAMLRPTTGSITVDDTDVATAPERLLPPLRATHFGFVFQDFNLLSALDATENVELACNLAGVVGQPARERAQGLLAQMGLGDRLRFRPDQLSGGEKQRVALARALANDAPVVLADEPTANLDSSHGHEIARLLRRLATEEGRSVVIVSHDDRLKQIADRILWLEDGQFRELAAMATDPVCRMAVETGAGRHQVHEERVYYFCSEHCREEFTAQPERFLLAAAGLRVPDGAELALYGDAPASDHERGQT